MPNLQEHQTGYYEVLEVDRNASSSDIRKAYLRLCSVKHPDRGGNPDEFLQVRKAFAVLSNHTEKAAYDENILAKNRWRAQDPETSQVGVVPGVHIRVHGQTGLSAQAREAKQAANILKAQVLEAECGASEDEWRRRDAAEAAESQQRGNAAFRNGDVEGAIEHYTAAVRLVQAQWGNNDIPHIHAATLYSNRAAAFTKLGNFNRALADTEEAIERRPLWCKAHLRLGVAHLSLKQYSEATEALSKAMELASSTGDEGVLFAAQQKLIEAKEKKVEAEKEGGEAGAAAKQVMAQLEAAKKSKVTA
mmetsp:Transcript_22445/g.31204  ORF Transcript_22445/g.31204 Transcript_22445/m.31204 type:complete len:305 (+) Transcript_22445:53-967(+)|eukprot:CAMPEP_0196584042 /NCGR_PEP_ID=MMETSP1081-20130531/45545_1 /TAXON_ID=36882 /ORGANISM="Pyramimonas amylifera, Strain CCMP720" /LENGTH=304 /DNA_ID=CAMNT_0041905119 /DNA_START=43 /DNA_END=957 /DNA_ORIENTATION=+